MQFKNWQVRNGSTRNRIPKVAEDGFVGVSSIWRGSEGKTGVLKPSVFGCDYDGI